MLPYRLPVRIGADLHGVGESKPLRTRDRIRTCTNPVPKSPFSANRIIQHSTPCRFGIIGTSYKRVFIFCCRKDRNSFLIIQCLEKDN